MSVPCVPKRSLPIGNAVPERAFPAFPGAFPVVPPPPKGGGNAGTGTGTTREEQVGDLVPMPPDLGEPARAERADLFSLPTFEGGR